MITIAFYDTDYMKGTQILENLKVMTCKCLGHYGRIKGIESVDKADFQIVLDHTPERLVDPKRTIYFGREPYYYTGGFNDFKDVEEAFAILQPANGDCYRYQNWWIGKTYDELLVMKPPQKTKLISAIVSGKSFLKGHQVRLFYIDNWLKHIKHLDLYGKWKHSKSLGELDDKFDGLRDYKYSIAMENGQARGYFTEKLIDVMLSWTVPLYWGCPNLADYFPENSYILINGDLVSLFERLTDEINMEALAEARQLILNRYQFWATIENVIFNDGKINWNYNEYI